MEKFHTSHHLTQFKIVTFAINFLLLLYGVTHRLSDQHGSNLQSFQRREYVFP